MITKADKANRCAVADQSDGDTLVRARGMPRGRGYWMAPSMSTTSRDPGRDPWPHGDEFWKSPIAQRGRLANRRGAVLVAVPRRSRAGKRRRNTSVCASYLADGPWSTQTAATTRATGTR